MFYLVDSITIVSEIWKQNPCQQKNLHSSLAPYPEIGLFFKSDLFEDRALVLLEVFFRRDPCLFL